MKLMGLSYCYLCGGQLVKQSDRFVCLGCRQEIFENPKPCVEIAIFNKENQILLAKRATDPFRGKYDLPGGFMDVDDDSLEMALRREISEELSIKFEDIKNVRYALSYTSKYPWGKDTYNNIAVTFLGQNYSDKIEAKDDVESLHWFDPDKIDKSELASPKLGKVIDKLVKYNKSEEEC